MFIKLCCVLQSVLHCIVLYNDVFTFCMLLLEIKLLLLLDQRLYHWAEAQYVVHSSGTTRVYVWQEYHVSYS